MTYRALKEVGGAETKLLLWLHTSYLSLSFEAFDSIICKK